MEIMAGVWKYRMKERIYWIDNIRAIAMISMIVYHAVWDLVYLYGINWSWYRGEAAFLWQQSICWTFILLSGFCWSFSKNPLKQGVIVSGAGLLVTVVTLAASYESRIVFGVLTMIGASTLLLIPLRKYFEKIPSYLGCLFMFVLFAVTYGINDGGIGFLRLQFLELPEILYGSLFGTFWGFTERGFFSSDYFSIMPWSFLYFSGFFLFRVWKEGKIPGASCLNRKIPVLTALGRNSLLVYLLHQPLIYGLLFVIFGK